MSIDREKELLSEGYERVKVQAVALPHTIWKLDFDIEFARPLSLAEETILRLIAAGVTKPVEITRLMGIDAGVIVPRTIVQLLRRGQLGQVDELSLTPLGRQALADHRARDRRTYEDVEVRHDPFSDSFLWKFDAIELKSSKEVRESGYHVLPAPIDLIALLVDVRHAEIQSLLDRFGLPFDSPEEQKKREQRDIVRLTAKHSYPAWRPAEVEVWYNAERQDWQWRLLYQEGEDAAISEVLRRLQSEGVQVLPLDDHRPEPVASPVGERVQRAVDAVIQAPRSKIIQTAQHRAILQEAVSEARRELIVVSPWLTTAAIDQELLEWFEGALQRQRELRIVVGYGIEADIGKGDRKARDQREALRRINDIGRRQHGRLRTVEIGHTHEKVVICDCRYAIITSFNWLSFNPKPSKGVRRETGTRVDDAESVKHLRESLVEALGLR